MRSDYFVMILMLSMASVLITYYGSYTEKRYVYDTAKNLQRRIDKKLRDVMPACCKALTKECLSCAAGLMVKDFCKRHQGEYGCPKNTTVPKYSNITYMKNNVKSEPKIMIAIPTYNRIGYTKFNAKVIRSYHKIPSKLLHIFDDCSSEYSEKDLRNWYGEDINFFPCKKRLKSDENIRRMFRYFAKSDFDIIFSVDTDLLFQKEWKEFILKNIDSTDGVMSLYHSNAPHHKTLRCTTYLCEKGSMGSAGTVMKKNIVKDMLSKNKNKLFDWGFVEIFKKKKIRMMVPKKSLIFHYGQYGQNNGCGTKEVARNFDRSTLPTWIRNGIQFYFDKCSSPSKLNDVGKDVIFHNTVPVENSLNANTINDIGTDICMSHPDGVMWNTFKNMIGILNSLKAPYNLHGGTLLSWYRDCSLGNQDIDVTLELKWFTSNNKILRKKLLANGWRLEHAFGTIGKAGYEEAWLKNKIKVDIFSQTIVRGKHTNGLTINGVTYPCTIEKKGTSVYKWSDIQIRVPVPIEDALKSLYNDWKTPVNDYVWYINPFKKGNQCTKSFTL